MSRLRIFDETHPTDPILASNDHAEITDTLAVLGVRFERWKANAILPPDASPDTVIAAYRDDLDRLMAMGGYHDVGVLSLHPAHREEQRAAGKEGGRA